MESELPIIDLSRFQSVFIDGENFESSEKDLEELKRLKEACEELGFFRVINHGVTPTLVEEVDAMARHMFTLPQETKDRAIFPNNFNSGYGPREVDPVAKDSTPENMTFPGDHLLPNSVDQICAKLWPQGNEKPREALRAYKNQMGDLSHKILKLVLRSLRVDIRNPWALELFEKSHGFLRMNYYDKCTNEVKISKPHTDVSCLTILYQDDVGGLQIRTKEGIWMDSKPLPGSFVINIGDCLQMWSNGRYRSAEHRVVYGLAKKNRLSMAYFLDFVDEFEIRSPVELIDAQHPAQYKAARKGDIMAYYKKVGPNLGIPLHLRLLESPSSLSRATLT